MRDSFEIDERSAARSSAGKTESAGHSFVSAEATSDVESGIAEALGLLFCRTFVLVFAELSVAGKRFSDMSFVFRTDTSDCAESMSAQCVVSVDF
jgi:hypothetical protein